MLLLNIKIFNKTEIYFMIFGYKRKYFSNFELHNLVNNYQLLMCYSKKNVIGKTLNPAQYLIRVRPRKDS